MIEVEKTFNSFVQGFGGELISELFTNLGTRPLNADYFFRDRSIVAELKCVEKDYSSSPEVGQKANLLIQKWLQAGLLRPEHMKQAKNGRLRFETDDLPNQCAAEMFDLFMSPVEEAVKKANKQIKATKQHFDLPNAKGLLILAVDGNFSQNPQMTIHSLARLLLRKHSGIDSFIHFIPNMRMAMPGVDRQFQFWSSGPSRPESNTIESAYLDQISDGWLSFLEKTTGEEVTRLDSVEPEHIKSMRYIR